jgi:type III secretory pathway component EscU
MMTYAIVGLVVTGVCGLLYALYRFMYRAGTAKGQVDERLKDAVGEVEAVEEARRVEQEISDIMMKRPDTTATRKRLKDATF